MNFGLAPFVYAACLVYLVVTGCHVQSTTEAGTNNPRTLQSPSPTNTTSDLIDSGVFDNNPSALKAWLKFVGDGKYRVANGQDFRFSESAKKRLERMFEAEWYARTNYPALSGNISRRHGFKDFAAIVVDTKKTDAARFGLVIFNVVEPNKEERSVHWLFQDRDLSSAILSWHSDWPVLVFYAEDGSADPYYINWNENSKSYFLDKSQVGPDARAGRLREQAKP